MANLQVNFEQFRSLSEPVQMVVAAGMSLVAIAFIAMIAFICYQMIKHR